jgi:hypothetical protein
MAIHRNNLVEMLRFHETNVANPGGAHTDKTNLPKESMKLVVGLLYITSYITGNERIVMKNNSGSRKASDSYFKESAHMNPFLGTSMPTDITIISYELRGKLLYPDTGIT